MNLPVPRATAVTFLLQVVSIVLLFALHAIVGRRFGASDYGIFALTLSITLIASEASTLGWSRSVTRFLAEAEAADDPGQYQRIVRRSTIQTGVVSLLVSFGLAIAYLLSDSDPVLYSAGLVSAYSGHAVRKKILLQGELPGWAFTPLDIGLPALAILAVVFARLEDIRSFLLIFIGLAIASQIVGSVKLLMTIWPSERLTFSELLPDRQLRISLTVLLGVAAQMVLLRVDVLFLGVVASDADVGIYAAAARLARLCSFLQAIVALAFTPRIALSFAQGNRFDFRRLVLISTSLSAAFSLPVFAFVLAFNRDLSELFGSEFAAGSGLLVTLATGHLIVGLTGPTASYLVVTRHEKAYSWPMLAGAILTLTLLLPVHNQWGVAGVAVLMATVLGAMNLIQAFSFVVLNRSSLAKRQ